ncbi:MAG TPA: HPF/RaiA family ribosome-associated protein [Ignavibacteria bacterium]|nr:HPF/RaiA family ribosome-associated protein [Ignavibacteria bacterium]HQY51972.1 HPF/RaiA family ribosome-associated protein [Ignavibacteria bacterium]HRB00923.1 HPF/RaiA family ribosome-associated protein [Ignavibacteria bacterium]
MKIQINTDNHISGTREKTDPIIETISISLKRFSERITRIEVHLSDENSKKKGQKDIKCVLEARLKGMDPVAVTDHEDRVEDAVDGALDKMTSKLDTILGKLKSF